MGKMKEIHRMFSAGHHNHWVAWYLLRETKISDWFEAKEVAKKMREEYDKEQLETRSEEDN